MSKLTIEQYIEVLYKCADSIDSDDGVVQQAIRDCADKLEKHILEIMKEMVIVEKELCRLEKYMIAETYDYDFIQRIKRGE